MLAGNNKADSISGYFHEPPAHPDNWGGLLDHDHTQILHIEHGLLLISGDYQIKHDTVWNSIRPPGVTLAISLSESNEHQLGRDIQFNPDRGSYVSLCAWSREMPFQIHHPRNSHNRFVALCMDWSFFNAVLNDHDLQEKFDFLRKPNSREIIFENRPVSEPVRHAAEQIIDWEGTETLRTLFMKGKTIELLALCLDQFLCPGIGATASLRPVDVKKILLARDLITDRLEENWSLTQLSHEVGLNVKKLKMGFREVLGSTVFSFLREQRLMRAEQLIRQNGLNIDQAAFAVGYLSASHFSQVFKRRFGVVPSHYRAQNCILRPRLDS